MGNFYLKFRTSDLICILIFLLIFTWGCQPKELSTAKIYIKNNEWEKAAKQLELATKTHPQNAEAHFLLGQAYGHFARFEEMISQFETSLNISDKYRFEISQERERYWIEKYNSGIIALDKNEYQIAEEFVRSAIIIDPAKYEAHLKLAQTFDESDRLEKALQIYNKLLRITPDKIDLLSSIGKIYYRQRKFNDAITILEKVLDKEPENNQALANLAIAYYSIGKSEKAKQAFKRAIQVNPLDKNLLYFYGVFRYKQSNYEQAIQLFERVLEIDSNNFDATSNIGNAYLSMGEQIRKKLASTEINSFTYTEIQKLKSQAVLNYAKAIPYFKKAIELQPNHPTLWRNLGVAYMNSGEKEKGENALLKSEEIQIQMSR